jgi:UDP-galactopyranose mutase
MWGKEIEELDPNILKRVAVRDDDNELYFPNDSISSHA